MPPTHSQLPEPQTVLQPEVPKQNACPHTQHPSKQQGTESSRASQHDTAAAAAQQWLGPCHLSHTVYPTCVYSLLLTQVCCLTLSQAHPSAKTALHITHRGWVCTYTCVVLDKAGCSGSAPCPAGSARCCAAMLCRAVRAAVRRAVLCRDLQLHVGAHALLPPAAAAAAASVLRVL